MALERRHTSKNLTIDVDTEKGYMYSNWIGFQKLDTVKPGAERMLEILKKEKLTLVLNDNRNVTGPFQEAIKWLTDEWFPQMFAAGMQKFAQLESPSVFAKHSANQAITGTNKKDEAICIFTDEEEGRKWLAVQ